MDREKKEKEEEIHKEISRGLLILGSGGVAGEGGEGMSAECIEIADILDLMDKFNTFCISSKSGTIGMII